MCVVDQVPADLLTRELHFCPNVESSQYCAPHTSLAVLHTMPVSSLLSHIFLTPSLSTFLLPSLPSLSTFPLSLYPSLSLTLTLTVATARGRAFFGRGQGPIFLDDMRCTGLEPNISSCRADIFTFDCSHFEDAGVICSAICKCHSNLFSTLEICRDI